MHQLVAAVCDRRNNPYRDLVAADVSRLHYFFDFEMRSERIYVRCYTLAEVTYIKKRG